MRSTLTPFLLLMALGSAFSVQAQQASQQKITMSTITQGICGTVALKRGNHMPSPDAPPSSNGGSPAERDVLIFPILNMSQVDMGENGFINSVRDAKPIKQPGPIKRVNSASIYRLAVTRSW